MSAIIPRSSESSVQAALVLASGDNTIQLRHGQYEVIQRIAFAPERLEICGRTGAGKSVTITSASIVAVEAAALRGEQQAIAIYIAPTIALVHSIAKSVGQAGYDAGIRCFGGGLGAGEDAGDSAVKIIVCTPDQAFFNGSIRAALLSRPCCFFFADEVHVYTPHSFFRPAVLLLYSAVRVAVSGGITFNGADLQIRVASATIGNGMSATHFSMIETDPCERPTASAVGNARDPPAIIRLPAPPSGLCAVVRRVRDCDAGWAVEKLMARFYDARSVLMDAAGEGKACIVFLPEKAQCISFARRFDRQGLGENMIIDAQVYTGDTSSAARRRVSILASQTSRRPGVAVIIFATEALLEGADTSGVGAVLFLVPPRALEPARQGLGRISHSGVSITRSSNPVNAVFYYSPRDLTIMSDIARDQMWRMPTGLNRTVARQAMIKVLQWAIDTIGSTDGQSVADVPVSRDASRLMSTVAHALRCVGQDNLTETQLTFGEKNALLQQPLNMAAPLLGALVHLGAGAIGVAGKSAPFVLNNTVGTRDDQLFLYFIKAIEKAEDGPNVPSRADQEAKGRAFVIAFRKLGIEVGRLMASRAARTEARLVNIQLSRIRAIAVDSIETAVAELEHRGFSVEAQFEKNALVSDLCSSLNRKSAGRPTKGNVDLGLKNRVVSITQIMGGSFETNSRRLFALLKHKLDAQIAWKEKGLDEVKGFFVECERSCVLSFFDQKFGGENADDLAKCSCGNC